MDTFISPSEKILGAPLSLLCVCVYTHKQYYAYDIPDEFSVYRCLKLCTMKI